jgi:hypothetical protein
MQEVIVYLLVAIAAVFLVKKYGFSSKKKGNCNTGCDCH